MAKSKLPRADTPLTPRPRTYEGNGQVTDYQKVKLPMPREFNGKKYYGAADVAKIIGVGRTTVLFWEQQGLFKADLRAHDGRYLYEVERVMQLAEVYHRGWKQPAYLARAAQVPPKKEERTMKTENKTISDPDVAAILAMSKSERDQLKHRILDADPLNLFTPADNRRSTDSTRYIICPKCGNGSGKNHTPVDVKYVGDRWLYHCFRECGFQGNLLNIIADNNNLNLDVLEDYYRVLAIGARLIGDSPLRVDRQPARNFTHEIKATKPDEAPLIKDDIAAAQKTLELLPKSQSRGLYIDTLQHFHCGFLPRWIAPCFRVPNFEGYVPPPSRRIIIPTPDGLHYHALALDADRENMKPAYHKQHAGAKTRLFNEEELFRYHEIVVIVEGEIDAMSIWQATKGKLPVVATLGVGGWKDILPALFDAKKIVAKKFLVLFDADSAGKDNSAKLVNALQSRNVPAVAKFCVDFLSPEDKAALGDKADANAILKLRGNEPLREILLKIYSDAQDSFNADSAFDNAIRLWREKNNNAPVNPDTLTDLLAAKKFIDSLTADAFIANFAYDLKYRNFIALLKFYTPAYAPKFFSVLRQAVDLAKYNCKANPFSVAEKVTLLANIAPSSIEREIDLLVTNLKQQQKKYQADFERQQAEQEERDRWQKKQEQPKNPDLELTEEQIDFLFGISNTDLDNAYRLNFLYGNQIRFAADTDRWWAFDKSAGIWKRGVAGSSSIILPFAERLAKTLDQNEPSPDEHPNARKIIDAWKNNSRVASSVSILRGVESIRITTDDFDNHPELLNCLNGVVDLQTGKLYDIVDPSLLLTQKANAAYLPGAESPVLSKFLRDILPDANTLAAILRWFGYCLTGLVNEEKVLFIHGKGGNGKGTLLKLVMSCFGNYAITLPVTAIIESGRSKDAGAATPELNGLEKCRFAAVDELPQAAKLNVAQFKSLSGGDKIAIRRLHEEFHNIDQTHKLMLSGNYLPTFNDARDPGLLRRLFVIYFLADFTLNPDRHLKEKLLTPEARNAFLTLLVYEAQDWFRDGLLESPAMKNAASNYLADNDFLAEFINESCVYGADERIELKAFLSKLRAEYPVETRPLSDRSLRDLVKRFNGIFFDRDKGKSRRTCICGIGWADSYAGDAIDANMPPPY